MQIRSANYLKRARFRLPGFRSYRQALTTGALSKPPGNVSGGSIEHRLPLNHVAPPDLQLPKVWLLPTVYARSRCQTEIITR